MDRKEFLQKGFSSILGLAMAIPAFDSCKTEADVTGTTATTGTCTSYPVKEEGPFPTKVPSSFVLKDIRSDRTGVPFTINVIVQNKNKNCTALDGVIFDIWHCDKDGNYSEYGGSGMQSVDYTKVDFLRGRQTTDSTGQVTFTSIYPGWYSGRAPHFHVHIYTASGTSLLITQVGFPEDINNTVYTTSNLYTRGRQDTSNSADHVFSGSTDILIAKMTGSVSAGYVLNHTIVVSA